MKENMYHTRSIRITKPLSNLQLKYIPPSEHNMCHDWPAKAENCHYCQTIHDHPLNPNAKEFIPRLLAGIENTSPSGSGPWPASPRARTARSGASLVNRPAQRPAPSLPGGPAREAGPSLAGVAADTCNGDAGQSTGPGADGGSAAARHAKSVKVGAEAASRCTVSGLEAKAAAGGTAGPAGPPTSEPGWRPADTPLQRDAEKLSQKQKTATVQNGAERPASPSTQCDSFIVSPTSAEETELCQKINSVCVLPSNDVPCCSSTGLESIHNASDISKRTRSLSQCSDSTKPRRANSRDSRANSLVMCAQSAGSPTAAAVIPCPPSACASEHDASAAAGRGRLPLCLSSASISAESSDDSSDESSDDDDGDDDSTLGNEEWDSSAVTFLPGSSVDSADSADDFILFVGEDECCPAEATRSPAAASRAPPQTPVFGPCTDQVDSGLSAEMDPSESDAEDFTEDELDEDECDLCQSAPAGTCVTHQRIAEANQQLDHWCDTPPAQPRTCKVRFLSGEGLTTVHAAPDYDRAIASDLLDQQRQRDRQCRWREEVDRQVAPLLAAVLAPEHRQRVLRQRPELDRSGS